MPASRRFPDGVMAPSSAIAPSLQTPPSSEELLRVETGRTLRTHRPPCDQWRSVLRAGVVGSRNCALFLRVCPMLPGNSPRLFGSGKFGPSTGRQLDAAKTNADASETCSRIAYDKVRTAWLEDEAVRRAPGGYARGNSKTKVAPAPGCERTS